MLKKSFKVRGHEDRTNLVEFLVSKRVKFFEFLQSLHSEDGALWMNAIYMDRQSIGRFFGVHADCLTKRTAPTSDGGTTETPGMVRIPLDDIFSGSDGGNSDAAMYVSLDKLPQSPGASVSEWQKRILPCYVSLSMSIADLLQVPISGKEFVESLYHLLLEVDVAYASGTAAKALALHSLKSNRQVLSETLKSALRGGSDSSNENLFATSAHALLPDSDRALDARYLFLQTQHSEYTAGSPSYDTVIPALCAVLIFAYRKMCDLELTKHEDSVKKILSIDKRIQKLVLHRLGKVLSKTARQKYVREAFVLSVNGMFNDLGANADEANFISEIISSQVQNSSITDSSGAMKEEHTSSSDSD